MEVDNMHDCAQSTPTVTADGSATIVGVSPILLSTVFHLTALDRADAARLAADAECLLSRPGHTIYRQADAADKVFVVLEGLVMLEHRDVGQKRSGYRQVFCGRGTFGDHLVLGDEERYYTATAVSPSLILGLPWPLLCEALSTKPQVRDAWIDEILLRLYRDGLQGASPQAIRSAAVAPAQSGALSGLGSRR
jgi:CRP-like cAMP-binding protein